MHPGGGIGGHVNGEKRKGGHHPDRRGAAFRVPLPLTICSTRGIFRPNRGVSCGSLKRVTGPRRATSHGATRFSASRLWYTKYPAPNFRSATPYATSRRMRRPSVLGSSGSDIGICPASQDEQELIPTELRLLSHFPGQISDHSRLSDRPGNRPKLSRYRADKAFAWRPDASAAFIKVDLFRSPR